MRKSGHLLISLAAFMFLFTFTQSVGAKSGQTYEVGVDALNVRSAPHEGADVVGKLKLGDQVTVFKEEHGWVSTFYDGEEVWIASHFLFKSDANAQPTNNTVSNEAQSQITIVADSVRLRSGPGTNHAIIGHVSKGDSFKVIEKKNDWSKIKRSDGSEAWVASWLTSEGATKNPTSNPPASKAEHVSTSSSKKSAQPLAGYNIMLDPGHGGIDPGALSLYAEKEKVLALDFSKVIAERLREAGATVLLTRSKDAYVSLPERVRISEAYLTDAFISIHFNAYTSSASNGISTHYYKDGKSKELAQHIQSALNRHTTLTNRGVKQDNYYVLRENSKVSVLVELGFITNPTDLKIIGNGTYSSDVSEAILEGLIDYFQ